MVCCVSCSDSLMRRSCLMPKITFLLRPCCRGSCCTSFDVSSVASLRDMFSVLLNSVFTQQPSAASSPAASAIIFPFVADTGRGSRLRLFRRPRVSISAEVEGMLSESLVPVERLFCVSSVIVGSCVPDPVSPSLPPLPFDPIGLAAPPSLPATAPKPSPSGLRGLGLSIRRRAAGEGVEKNKIASIRSYTSYE